MEEVDEDYVEEDVAWPSSGTARKQCRLCVVGAAAVGGCSCGSRSGCAAAASPSGCSRRAASPKLSAPCSAAHRHLALLHLRRLEPLRTRWAPKLAAVRPERAHMATVVSSESARYVRRGASARAGAVRAAGPPLAPLYVWSRTSRRSCRRSYSKWVLYDGVGRQVCLCGVQKSRARYPRCDVYPVKSSTISHV